MDLSFSNSQFKMKWGDVLHVRCDKNKRRREKIFLYEKAYQCMRNTDPLKEFLKITSFQQIMVTCFYIIAPKH